MNLQESGEMYLETILILSNEHPTVRSLDVAEYRNFSKPSVSRAMKLLRDGGYITVDKDGYLHLTEIGREMAEKIYDRHRVLEQFLMNLGVDEDTASQDACRMEHVISDTTLTAIKNYLDSN
ncbi:MAG: metal-dependent transcriptional regulator [Clostridia bacterium]|nr:metal-dependent transcriptional regulator [Clostridia bacterium]